MTDLYLSTEMLRSVIIDGTTLEPILQTVNNTIKKGGRVIIQNEFVKPSVEVKKILSTPEELEEWKKDVDPEMIFSLFSENAEIGPVADMQVTSEEQTYDRMVIMDGKPVPISSKPPTLIATFTCNSTVQARLELHMEYYLCNKQRLKIPIVVRSIANNVVTATVSRQ